MARKAILSIALIGILLWTVACGRSRNAQVSDTPVPTVTIAPTEAPAPTNTATAAPTDTVAPTDTAAPTDTVEPTATEMPAATEAPSATPAAEEPTEEESTQEEPTMEVTATPTITEGAGITETTSVTEVPEIAGTSEITETSEIAESTEVSESSEMSASREVTVVVGIVDVEEEQDEEKEETATPAPTSTVTTAPTATTAATATPQPTMTSTATTAPTATTEPTATAQPTATTPPTPTTQPTPTSTMPPTATKEPTPTVQPTATTEARTRQAIALPLSLASSVEISGAMLLTDVISDAIPAIAELSPDGSRVAWLASGNESEAAKVCVAEVDGGEADCVEIEGYQGLPYHLVWSPDGRWIAFSEDPSAQSLESDIWLFDTTTGEAVNRSDDAATGRVAEVDGVYSLDYLPMWDPSTGYLYFWRSTPDGEGIYSLDLMRLDPESEGEAELVRSFGQTLGDGLVRFGWQRFYLQGPSAISPDGSKLAVSIAPAQEMDLTSGHVLWLIDLLDPEAEPTHLASSLDWQAALPQWSNQPAVARGLQWTEDGRGIVVAALSSDLRLPLLLAYYVDAEGGDITPIVDFSDSEERDAFFRMDPTSKHAPRFDVPWTVALAPNANVLLMVTDLGGVVRVLAVPLPPDGEAPEVIYEMRSPGYEAWTRGSTGEDGKVYLYGYLMDVEPSEN